MHRDLGVLCGLFFSILLVTGCAPAVYYVKPPDWKVPSLRDSVILYYGRYYQSRTIFLDPGHGGEDRFNEAPGGEKEADINLRVALNLQNFLTQAGAKVILSRRTDSTVALRERSRMANEIGADVFISIHHNSAGDEFTNYTSTYYHAVESDSEYHPSNHDVARYIQRDLSYVLGNSGPLTSFDGTLSDYTVYPLSGFSVLRHTKIPAVLIEGAFFSSEYEEKRLKAEEFNEIGAWGIFRGLGKYWEAGVPHIEFVSAVGDTSYRPMLQVQASDGSGIDWKTAGMRIDGKEATFFFDATSGLIWCVPEHDLSSGPHLLEMLVRNKNGNWSLPFRRPFTIRPKPYAIELEVSPERIPPDENAMAFVTAEVRDRKGQAVADSTTVELSVSRGIVPSPVYTKGGRATTFLRGTGEEGLAVLIARSGEVVDSDTLQFVADESRYLTGFIGSALDGQPIANAFLVVKCSDRSQHAADTLTILGEGRFIWAGGQCDTVEMTVQADGYYGEQSTLILEGLANTQVVELEPVANGTLFGQTFLIDPRYGGTETGDIADDGLRSSDVNLAVAEYLSRLLKASGADVHLLRREDESIPESTRVYYSKRFRDGFYIRIDASNRSGKAGCFIYRSLTNTKLAHAVVKGITHTADVDTFGVRVSNERFYSDVAIGTITVVLPSVRDPFYRSNNLKHLESSLAWGIYRGILKDAGYEGNLQPLYVKRIVDEETGRPAAGMEVVLDFALPAVTDDSGVVKFFDVEGLKGKLQVKGKGVFEIKTLKVITAPKVKIKKKKR